VARSNFGEAGKMSVAPRAKAGSNSVVRLVGSRNENKSK
jgi:hypothetical protein